MGLGASAVILQWTEIGTGVANIARPIKETPRPRGRVSAGCVVTQVVAIARDEASGVHQIGARGAGLKNGAAKKKHRSRAGIEDGATRCAVVPRKCAAVEGAVGGIIQ